MSALVKPMLHPLILIECEPRLMRNFLLFISPFAILCALATSALADHSTVAELTMDEEFDDDTDYFSGKTDWESLYCNDPWRTDTSTGVAPDTDDGCSNPPCIFPTECSFGTTQCNSSPRNNILRYRS